MTDGREAAEPQGRPLEEALRAAYADAARWPFFYRLFLASTLWIPTDSPVPEAAGWCSARTGERFSIPVVEQEGRRYVAVFSSLAQLERWATGHGEAYLQMHAVDFLRQLDPDLRLLLDPASEYPKEFSAQEVQALLGATPEAVHLPAPPGTRFRLGPPPEESAAVAEALRARLRTLPEVSEAYLAEIEFPDSGERPHLIVGIRFRDPRTPRAEQTYEMLHLAILPLLPAGEIVDFTGIGSDTSAGPYFLTESAPFYWAA